MTSGAPAGGDSKGSSGSASQSATSATSAAPDKDAVPDKSSTQNQDGNQDKDAAQGENSGENSAQDKPTAPETSAAPQAPKGTASGEKGATASQGQAMQSAQSKAAIKLHHAQAAVQHKRAALVSRWQDRAKQAVQFAYRQRGRPYLWGGTGHGGFDCSGLVQTSWHKAGVSIPRVAADQYRRIRTHVAASRLRPGDLLYFDHLGHVGLYVGGGRFIHSPHTGSYVQVVRLNGYWREHFAGAARPAWPKLPSVPTRLV